MLLLLVFFLRVSRGLLGIVLAGLAVVLILYWIRELRRTVKQEWHSIPRPAPITTYRDTWDYELVDNGNTITLVAVVPGPASEVKARIEGHVLAIQGGSGFRKLVKLPTRLSIRAISYVNGVLNVKLQRAGNVKTMPFDDASSYDSL